MSQYQECNWNSFKQNCQYGAISSEYSQNSETYCEQFSQTNCNKLQPCEFCVKNGPCQWYGERCSHFTGCTAFNKSSTSQCQSISERCITDGIHCVEIGTCDSYKTEIACKQDMNNIWCFWDQNNMKCQYPQSCEELPLTFTQDYQCKSQISTCVSNQFGGCKTQTQTEIYTTTNSVESESLSQGIQQQKYKTCQEITVISDCETYEGSIKCFWQDNKCIDKICQNASKNLKKNSECQQFLSYCITTNGGGCINNGSCMVANISEACSKDINEIDCFWNDL
ncbi:unnamed protein product [Paramecium sonneborni]|uniref:Uncharacterized protein n=1 Tax=Paramecium sonneborni TaxID=65129 RepID=A0A8S1RHH5_9CILI|nr:unnamed protein product [Paramecium sonneborni]